MPTGSPRSAIVLAILVAVGVGAWTAYYTVSSDSVAVVQRFGKYLKDVPKRGSPMDKVQSFINAFDAVLRSGTEQAAMRAQTGKLFVDVVTDLRSQLDLHSHADRPHHAGGVLMKVRHQLRGIDYPLPEQEAVRDDLVARIEQTIREVEPGRLGPRPGPI